MDENVLLALICDTYSSPSLSASILYPGRSIARSGVVIIDLAVVANLYIISFAGRQLLVSLNTNFDPISSTLNAKTLFLFTYSETQDRAKLMSHGGLRHPNLHLPRPDPPIFRSYHQRTKDTKS